MRVILVDDELKALNHLDDILCNFNYVNIVGKFTNSFQAQNNILLENPDVVFLDIHMPIINGIDLAKNIKKLLPDISIVFTTAHSNYAIKAFELNVNDYILKPFNPMRIKSTLDRLSISKEKFHNNKSTPSLPVIRMFQSLKFTKDFNENSSLNLKWRTKKVKGVFMYLLQQRGKFVLKDSLLEEFWPDFELNKGYTQLYATIYQIRKTLKSVHSDVEIINYEDSYKLKLNNTKLDVNEWETWLRRLPFVTSENVAMHKVILDLYTDDYLVNEEFIWMEGERERLKTLWIEYILNLAEYFTATDQITEAILLYLRLQSVQPYIDTSYYKLMILYDKLGDVKSVESQYSNLKEMLLIEHGLKPKDNITQWYEKWRMVQVT